MTSRRLWIVLGSSLLLLLGLAWLRFIQPANPTAEGNLAGASLGGPLALVDQDGRRVAADAFDGRYRLIYFGYTFCPDVCPTDVQMMAQGLKTFETEAPARAARVQPIFITVDPGRDTPAALKAFVTAFHPRLIGLTGTQAEIDAARKAYGIYAKQVPTSDPANYLVDHFAVVYLFGPRGQPIAFLPHEGLNSGQIVSMLAGQVR